MVLRISIVPRISMVPSLASVDARRESYVPRTGHRAPFLTSPLGANIDPRGKVVPQG
jgi:hypothetical protein